MTTIPLHNPTSHHLFISTDDTEIVPNNLHPLWEHLSKDERSRVEYIANELVGLHEMEWLHPSNDHGPWRSAFEEAVNEAVWVALAAICPECVPGSIERVLDRAGLPSDALEFLPKHEQNGLKFRLSGTVLAAFKYGNDVEEAVHSELFGWLEEYTDSLGNNLNELIENARTGSESAVMELASEEIVEWSQRLRSRVLQQVCSIPVSVDIENETVVVFGKAFDIDQQLAAVVKCLLEANGERRSQRDMKHRFPKYIIDDRLDNTIRRKLNKHKSGIGRFIESDTRGYRMVPRA